MESINARKVETIEKEIRYLKTRSLVILIGATWLIYTALSVLVQFQFDYRLKLYAAIPTVLNASVWFFWGKSSYLDLISGKPYKLTEKYNEALYTVRRLSRNNVIIELLIALQFMILSALWVIAIAMMPT